MNDIHILENKRIEKSQHKKSTSILTFFLFIFVIILLVVANLIGKHFFSTFLFSLLFGFPLIIIYRVQIASMLPQNIAGYLVKNTEDVSEDIQTAVKVSTNPLYVVEVQMLILGILSLITSVYTLYKRKNEFIGILTSIFFTVLALIFINDLF